MIAERVKDCAAMMLIGNGVLDVLEPRRHVALWEEGPPAWQKLLEPFRDNPQLTRWWGVGHILLGVWLASEQMRPRPVEPQRAERRQREPRQPAPVPQHEWSGVS